MRDRYRMLNSLLRFVLCTVDCILPFGINLMTSTGYWIIMHSKAFFTQARYIATVQKYIGSIGVEMEQNGR